MDRRSLGSSSLLVSPLGVCCPRSPNDPRGRCFDENEAIAAMQAAVDAGVNYFETGGPAGLDAKERLLGRALQGRRVGLVIATACGPFQGPSGGFSRLALAACEASLRRLRVEMIDILCADVTGVGSELAAAVDAVSSLVQRGCVGAIGLEGAGCQAVIAARQMAAVAAVRARINVFDRSSSSDLLACCRESGVGVVACDPIPSLVPPVAANGGLAGRRATQRSIELSAFHRLERFAAARGRTVGQVSINWALRQAGVSTVAVEIARPTQLRDSLGWAFTPTDDDERELDEIIERRESELEQLG